MLSAPLYGQLTLPLLVLLFCSSCLRPSEDNSRLDEQVGELVEPELLVSVSGQGSALRESDNVVSVWAASPSLRINVSNDEEMTLHIRNLLPDAELLDGDRVIRRVAITNTEATFSLPAGERKLDLMAPDANDDAPYTFAVLSDLQEALPEVGDIIDRMNMDDDLRFVVSAGDITANGQADEYLGFREELERLRVPFYATPGNHELPNPENWNLYFGPFSTFFEFKGIAFSLLDSSNATVDPIAKERFDSFSDQHLDSGHLLFTHVPFLDPSGFRSLAFRSRNEAAAVTADVAAAGVDGIFFGHIHAYYAFSHGGIPTFVSGGGGATREARDGIFRHYLSVRVSPSKSDVIESVALVQVD